MINGVDVITVKLQISLNRKMYEENNISYDMYSKTNEILINRLTDYQGRG